jgi:hypothetical protein
MPDWKFHADIPTVSIVNNNHSVERNGKLVSLFALSPGQNCNEIRFWLGEGSTSWAVADQWMGEACIWAIGFL